MRYFSALLIASMLMVSSSIYASTDISDATNSQKLATQAKNVNGNTVVDSEELKKSAAQTDAKKQMPTKETEPKKENVKQNDGSKEFAGLRFGVGLSLTQDSGTRQRVETAELVNGVVRITNENDALARIMLESHYFFTPEFNFGINTQNSVFGVKAGSWGWGPFVAVQPGSKEIIEAIGFGFMLGFKRNNENADPGSSWNFGLGYVVDPNVQVLGDGLTANAELPEGEDAIRFKEVSQSGLLVLISFSF